MMGFGKSDGCTFFPDGDWRRCCVEHDQAYWRGGDKRDRLEADIHLFACIARKNWFAGWVAFLGVRLFGFIGWRKHERSK